MRRALAVVCALIVGALLAACEGDTEPVTEVTQTSAKLNAKASWQTGEGGFYWWRYRPVGGSWTNTPERAWGPAGSSGSSGTFGETVTGLTPGTTYEVEFCGRITSPGAGGPACFDSDRDGVSGEYDTFTTDSPPATDTDLIVWAGISNVTAMTEAQLDELTSYGIDGYALQLGHQPSLGGTQATFDANIATAKAFADNHPELKVYITTRLVHQSNCAPPAWFNDSAWSIVANNVSDMSDAAETSAIVGVGFDGEGNSVTPECWHGPNTTGHTQAETEAKAEDRGEQVAAVVPSSVEFYQYHLPLDESWRENVACQINSECEIYDLTTGDHWAKGLTSDGNPFRYWDAIFYKSPHTGTPCVYASPCSTTVQRWENAMRQNVDAWEASAYGGRTGVTVQPFLWISYGPGSIANSCSTTMFDSARTPAQFAEQAAQAQQWTQGDQIGIYHQGPFFPANCGFTWSDYAAGLQAASD